jgi:hypothetical protein
MLAPFPILAAWRRKTPFAADDLLSECFNAKIGFSNQQVLSGALPAISAKLVQGLRAMAHFRAVSRNKYAYAYNMQS